MSFNTEVSSRATNAQFIEMLDGSPEMQKTAGDTVTEFTRVRNREEGVMRKILPPLTITNEELDRQVDTAKPVRIVDKEPNSPAAISVPFGTLPINQYIQGPRYRVMFDRIVTPKFTCDVDELYTYDMDIRQVLSDNAVKDVLAEEDGKWFMATNAALLGQDVVIPLTGIAQWRSIDGGITRETVAEALKTLPMTPMHLEASVMVINNVSVKEFYKWGRDEIGGDLAEEILQNGLAERNIMGCRMIITIKRELVPDNSIYMYAEPNKLGKCFLLSDTTMFIDRRAYMLEFFGYETIGAAIGNIAACARVDFVQS